MLGQEARNKFTDYWRNHKIKEADEFAVLTILIHQEWNGISVKDHNNFKGLKTQNLRYNMSAAELIFKAQPELSSRKIVKNIKATVQIQYKDTSNKMLLRMIIKAVKIFISLYFIYIEISK